MGHLWFHTFHLPLCVTVINILLTQNTRLQWFTWANYTVSHTSVSIPPGRTVPEPFSLCLTSSLTISSPSYSLAESFFFSFPSSWVWKLFLIQSPYPILCRPLPHTDIPRPPGALLTLSPFLPNPGSCTISLWNRSSLSVQTCWQEPYSVSMRERIGREGRREVYRGMEREIEREHQKKPKTKSQQQQFIWRRMLLIQEW